MARSLPDPELVVAEGAAAGALVGVPTPLLDPAVARGGAAAGPEVVVDVVPARTGRVTGAGVHRSEPLPRTGGGGLCRRHADAEGACHQRPSDCHRDKSLSNTHTVPSNTVLTPAGRHPPGVPGLAAIWLQRHSVPRCAIWLLDVRTRKETGTFARSNTYVAFAGFAGYRPNGRPGTPHPPDPPSTMTRSWGGSSAGRALHSHCRGREFES